MSSRALIRVLDEKQTRHEKIGDRLKELTDEIPMMEEALRAQNIRSLEIAMWIFIKNFEHLREYLVSTIQEPISSPAVEQGYMQRWEDRAIEITRLLQNYVAAGVSYLDQTTRLVNDMYGSKPPSGEYWKRISSEFTSDPLSQFVKKLRDYFMHYSTIAPVFQTRYTARTSENDAAITRSALLPVPNLLRYKDWSKKAKDYMENKEVINIFDVIDSYSMKVAQFHDWMRSIQREMHVGDKKRIKAKKREQALLWLELTLDNCMSDMAYLRIFHTLISLDEWQAVHVVGSDPTAQAHRVIAVLGRGHSLTGTLKRRIYHLCHQPGFYIPWRPATPTTDLEKQVVIGPAKARQFFMSV